MRVDRGDDLSDGEISLIAELRRDCRQLSRKLKDAKDEIGYLERSRAAFYLAGLAIMLKEPCLQAECGKTLQLQVKHWQESLTLEQIASLIEDFELRLLDREHDANEFESTMLKDMGFDEED